MAVIAITAIAQATASPESHLVTICVVCMMAGIVTGTARLVNRLQRRPEKEHRLLFGCGPTAFAVDALPEHVEQRIQQDNRLLAPATRTADVVLVENLGDSNAASHEQRFGRHMGPR